MELKIQALPPPMTTMIGLFNKQVREAKEMLCQWDRPFLVDHSKFAERFWNDPTPFEVSIPATAAWYKGRSFESNLCEFAETAEYVARVQAHPDPRLLAESVARRRSQALRLWPPASWLRTVEQV